MTAHVDYADGRAEELLDELAQVTENDSRYEQIRTELVTLHAPLAKHLARRYASHAEPLEDIEQAALLGLVKAMNRFDPEVGDRFLAYAMPTMTGEVKRHFRDKTWSVRIPRPLQELRLELRRAQQDFTHDNGRSPTTRELAGLLKISEQEANDLLTATEAYRPISLDTLAASEDDTDTLGDLLPDDNPSYDDLIDRTALRPLLNDLPARERTILLHRYYGNKTQSEIGQLMDISQMHVSRLIKHALNTLQTALLKDP